MWKQTGRFILKYRFPLLIALAAITALSAFWASKVGLSYEFSRAIPTNHPVNIAYQEFKKKYGEDGNMLVVGVQTEQLFSEKIFTAYLQLQAGLKKIPGVEDVISVPTAINLVKNAATEKLAVEKIFPEGALTQTQIDSGAAVFQRLPFYQGLLYNPRTHAYLMGLRMNKEVINSAKRDAAIAAVKEQTQAFSKATGLDVKLSGLPYIRTVLAARIAHEMRYFLVASILLSAIILLLFFRSFSSMLLSLSVVIIGVLFSLGTMHLMEYSITLLTALIPPLIVVIGIPNCIYFLNKFHTSWNELTGDLSAEEIKARNSALKKAAIENMVGKMGIVTLFCNLAAAVGFAVFALTRSEILQEFGVVAGINIMLLFFISLVLIPVVLSFLPAPKSKHTRYLFNPRLNRWLGRLERWSINHRKLVYIVTLLIIGITSIGIFRLKSNAHMVDDVPQKDKIYTDLKFFESNFKGVMPLEIIVDTKKKSGVTRNFKNLTRIDSLAQYLASKPEIARPLSITEGLKFAKQAFYEGDSSNYSMPSEFELPGLAQYLNMGSNSGGQQSSAFTRLLSGFMDSTGREARISVNMADVGSYRLPALMGDIQHRVDQLFPAKDYNVKLTGTSITFLEGGRFIINGLKESIFWAFLLIALCMLYLFRSLRILLCSLIPNLIPLVITAGIMGWAGVPLKPSTVLIFSVALGIAIDITIRFLVNYKQELPKHQNEVVATVVQTIHSTGISILYTSMVLIAGFIIFCFSNFGGTQALGWLTSLTLITATFTNLILLPALLISFSKKPGSR
ncbi:efflux RND transporter permease subunit [Niabella beijingensis]|uniref:efflux RND transporter permease subunit n=1 Tax=Niabella beijingensis TaxID=2872700 RepID=UPI001CC0C09B|nr:MMPL family transporter [Niabella beijingensis]MBZ4189834.1 MMPL family transporter [Niabella beijingensis]